MKRMVLTVLACTVAVGLSAQTPPPDQTQKPATKQTSPSMDTQNKVTVTGCLERAKEEASPTGTAGEAKAMGATKFVLNNVTSEPSAAGTAGTSGAARPTASSYRLDADDAKLTAHVGHKVSITGTVESRASATGASRSESAPKLKVETVTHVSPTCTP